MQEKQFNFAALFQGTYKKYTISASIILLFALISGIIYFIFNDKRLILAVPKSYEYAITQAFLENAKQIPVKIQSYDDSTPILDIPFSYDLLISWWTNQNETMLVGNTITSIPNNDVNLKDYPQSLIKRFLDSNNSYNAIPILYNPTFFVWNSSKTPITLWGQTITFEELEKYTQKQRDKNEAIFCLPGNEDNKILEWLIYCNTKKISTLDDPTLVDFSIGISELDRLSKTSWFQNKAFSYSKYDANNLLFNQNVFGGLYSLSELYELPAENQAVLYSVPLPVSKNSYQKPCIAYVFAVQVASQKKISSEYSNILQILSSLEFQQELSNIVKLPSANGKGTFRDAFMYTGIIEAKGSSIWIIPNALQNISVPASSLVETIQGFLRKNSTKQLNN